MKTTVLIIATSLLTTACVGMQPRTSVSMESGNLCQANLKSDPELAGLNGKVALSSSKDQNFDLLSNKSKPSDDDKQLLKLWGNKRDICFKLRQKGEEELGAASPIQTLRVASDAAHQALLIELINDSHTYGEFAIKRHELNTKIASTYDNIVAELRKEDQAANFRAQQIASQYQSNWIMQQKVANDREMQQQQINNEKQRINAANWNQSRHQSQQNSMITTSTTTDCQANGPSGVRCTTY